jgi:protein-S-isoprenylcysteine O-methyltransferase Ste14
MNIIIFITGTFIIITLSWFLSIKHKRFHGIPRFFSFETIFIMTMLNLKVWFCDPFSAHQVISFILLILSLYPVSAGYYLLKRKGNPDSNFENTSTLVRSGIYGYIRHPLYLSLFLLGTGVMFKNPDLIQVILGTINFGAIVITARIEEKEMITKFGEEYKDYMTRTKMFIPFIV